MTSGSPDYEITLWGKPHCKMRTRAPKGGGRTYQPREDREAEEATRLLFIGDGVHPTFSGPLWVGMEFFLPDRIHRDADNLAKHIMDSANGILWADDNQVTSLWITKRLDRINPRTVLSIWPDVGNDLI